MKIIGDGGHALVVRDVLAHFKDSTALIEGKIVRFADIEATFIAVGDNAARKREAEAATGPFLKVVHPSAYVSPSAQIGDGTIIMAGAIIQPGAVIGKHCIVNSGAVVDHECVLEDYVHIAPRAALCGNVRVGEGALVAVGVGIGPGASIPAWSVVKARRLHVEPVQSHG